MSQFFIAEKYCYICVGILRKQSKLFYAKEKKIVTITNKLF